MKTMAVLRKGDSRDRKKASRGFTDVGGARGHLTKKQENVKKLESHYQVEKAKLEKAEQFRDDMDSRLGEVQEEIDAAPLPEGAQPIARIAKRDNLKMQKEQLDVAVSAQEKQVRRAWDALHAAEREMFRADKEMHMLVDQLEEAEASALAQKEMDIFVSEQLAHIETDRARKWETDQKKAIRMRSSQVKTLFDKAQEQQERTAMLNRQARDRMGKSLGKTARIAKDMQEHKDHMHEERTEVVMQLKADMDYATSGVRKDAARNNAARKAAEDKLASEKETMLAKGLNPYAEFRRSAFDREAATREKALLDKVEVNKATLAESMIKENEDRRKEEALQKKERDYEQRHRDEQGRHVTEHRNANYIKRVTVGGLEVLDAAGRAARVDPSQITEIADNSYGLGKSSRIPKQAMQRITDRIRQSLNLASDDLGEYKRLVTGILPKGVSPAKLRGASRGGSDTMGAEDEGEDDGSGDAKRLHALDALADRTGALPGAAGAATEVNLAEGEDDVAKLLKIVEEENLGDTGGDDGADLQDAPEKKFPPVEQSKFEKDAFERAKGRMISRLQDGQTQIAGGKEFKGQSFVPKPSVVQYKDFEVGVTYKRKFTLTNASYTFNSFRIIDLPDEIIDFFVITYDKPGRMSAGVTCSLEVTFTPQINEDIFSEIRFYTETGPVAVPLVCLKKRCAPRVLNADVTVDDMVVGQKQTLPLQLKNTEALGTPLSITRIDPIVSTSATPSSEASEEGGEDSPPADAGADADAVIAGAADDFTNLEALEPRENSSPAANSSELWARVRAALTAVLRRKKKEDPFPVSVRLMERGGNTGPKPPAGEEPQPGDVLQCDGYLDGYSSAQVEIVTAPLEVGPVLQRFNVTFSGVIPGDDTKDGEGRICEMNQEVTVRTNGLEMPIYVGEEIIDLKCTVHGRIYRKRVELRNRGKTAFRVDINVPPPYDKYIEVSPDMLFVQGNASQDINLKFVPREDILDFLPHYTRLHEDFTASAEMAIPVEMRVVNQELPIFFVVKADVTPSTLVLSTPSLDFGQVYVDQRSTLPLTVKNTSMLPQKIGFVKLRRELKVEPNGGFAVLLPNEEMTFEVACSPSTPEHLRCDLQLVTSLNDTYTVGISCKGLEPSVVLDTSVVHMRSTCPGERVLESVRIQNKSSKRQRLEIMLPDSAFTWIKVSPTVFDLVPGASERFEIEFLPPAGCDDVDPHEWYTSLDGEKSPFTEWMHPFASPPAVTVGGEDGAGEAVPLDKRWAWGKGPYGSIQWTVKAPQEEGEKPEAAVTKAGAESAGADGTTTEAEDGVDEKASGGEGGEEDEEKKKKKVDEAELQAQEWGVVGRWCFPIFTKQKNASDPTMPIFFAVESTTVLPELVCSVKRMDFGQMAIGTRELQSIKVRNTSNKDIHLKSMGLSAVGPFTVLPFIRNLRPGATQNLVVECHPTRPGLFTEVLTMYPNTGKGHQLQVTLKTQGVDPVVRLEGLLPAPNNWSPQGGILYCGDVVQGDVCQKTFSIVNQSEFSVKVNISRTICENMPPFRHAELVQRTATGLPIFSFSPENAVIESGASLVVTAAFRPDRSRQRPFREDINIDVGQADGIIKVCLVGRPLDRQLFVAPGSALDEQFAFSSSAEKDILNVTVENLQLTQTSEEVKTLVGQSAATLRMQNKERPPIILEFADPYGEGVSEESYTAVEPGAKGGPTVAGRQQTKSLLLGAAEVADGRVGAGAGSYEILLGEEAKASGLFTLTGDKGSLSPGGSAEARVACTLPQPKGIGGLQVGSWQTFPCSVILKGGWKPDGEADENKVDFLLRAFVGF